jgi:anti-anti-sigma regulatory factor
MKISIEGKLNIQMAGELKAQIAAACADEDAVEIIHGNISEVDVTYLQMLTALEKTCQAAGRELKIYSDNSAALINAIEKSGFLNIKLTSTGV